MLRVRVQLQILHREVGEMSDMLLLLLSHFSRVRLCDPIDGSPPGSPVLGILQARTLEWVAISFSNAWKWKVKGKSLSRVWPSATPWTAAYKAPPSMGFSRQESWSGMPLPFPCQTWGSRNTILPVYYMFCSLNSKITLNIQLENNIERVESVLLKNLPS